MSDSRENVSRDTVDRSHRYRRLALCSFLLLLAAVAAAALVPVRMWFAVRSHASGSGWRNASVWLGMLRTHGAAAALCAMVSVICGLAVVRHRLYVLWWILPEIIVIGWVIVALCAMYPL